MTYGFCRSLYVAVRVLYFKIRIFDDDDEEWKTSTGEGSITFSHNAEEIRFDNYEEIRGDDSDSDPFRSHASGLPKLSHNTGRSESGHEWSPWWHSSSQDRPSSSTSSKNRLFNNETSGRY